MAIKRIIVFAAHSDFQSFVHTYMYHVIKNRYSLTHSSSKLILIIIRCKELKKYTITVTAKSRKNERRHVNEKFHKFERVYRDYKKGQETRP